MSEIGSLKFKLRSSNSEDRTQNLELRTWKSEVASSHLFISSIFAISHVLCFIHIVLTTYDLIEKHLNFAVLYQYIEINN